MNNNIKSLVLGREAAITAGLVGAAVIAPLFHQQLVTGTIVNAALFLAVAMFGFRAAAVVAVAPSLIALAAGTLPLAMAAMVPYIMASNLALAGAFASLRKAGYWLAAAVAGGVKFGILVLSANFVLAAVTHGQIGLALASMMGWPQLITALSGSILAFALIRKNN